MEDKKEQHPKHKIHHLLAHSYYIYFFGLILGVLFDLYINISIFNAFYGEILGFILLFLGTFLVVWAQGSSLKLHMNSLTKESFCRGPYCYTRTPTHYGLFFLVVGLSFVLNAFFLCLFAILSFLITKILFVKKQEIILSERYGQPYIEYKEKVKF